MLTANLLQNKYLNEPTTACKDHSCSSLLIEDCAFSEFSAMKPDITYVPTTKAGSAMIHQGKILNLEEFYGPIVLKGNTFTTIKVKWEKWETLDGSPSNNNGIEDSFFLPTSFEEVIDQAKTLVYINVKDAALEIHDNTFTNCSSLLGLIYLKRPTNNTGSILIHNNSFIRNSALIGSNVLKIYLYTTDAFSDEFNADKMPCANTMISNNTFTNNIGCNATIGAIQVVWYNSNIDLDSTTYKEHYGFPRSMNMEDTAFNLAKDGIINFNSQNYVILPSSGVGMDTNMFVLSNIYDGNFAGRMASITEIKNIRKVHITGELYINNRGTYSEALEKFGMIHSISTYATAGLSYSISQYFDYSNKSNYIPTLFSSVLLEQQYPVSPLYIEGSFYISIADSVFDNNVFPEITSDKQSSYYSSPGITIKACNGDLHIKSLTFQNYQGMSVTEINSITGTEK